MKDLLPQSSGRAPLPWWALFGFLLLLAGLGVLLPSFPCDSGVGCRDVYHERMRISQLRTLSPDQSAALKSLAWEDSCGRCSWGGRISLLRVLFDEHWNLKILRSQRA
ncbi:MAG TPA: hypothetical protein VMU54_01150 [Planctomycetota bacterium]|nr:hypothetical protein [Planctomycetota bacterium]